MAKAHPELFAEPPVADRTERTKPAVEACMSGQADTLDADAFRALDYYAVENFGFVPREVLAALEERAGGRRPGS